MQDSMAHAPMHAGVELPSWKTGTAVACAILLALMWFVAGGWKVTDPFGAAARLAQAQVPGWLSLPGTITLGLMEVLAGVLLLIPRLRRWGAILSAGMMVFFMLYVGYYYDTLRGEECSCFPMIQRAVGPMFFVTDGIMLLMCLAAWVWSRPSEGLRTAAMILGALAVFAGASYGAALMRNSGTKAPDFITVDGKRTSLAVGKVFLYFYDPECSHCDEAARRASKWNWKDTKVITVPTRQQQFAAEFLTSTGLKGGITPDAELLKKTFPFGDPPYGVSLENGRQRAAHAIFDKQQPEAELRKLGFIE
ncbi:MAG: DoxX family protein [Bryobacterales bacterium]|nr:DoxX family protein [Bryobacterales bacterium]